MSRPDIFSPEYEKNPYPFYKAMRDEHPLYFHEAAQGYVVSRFEDVAKVLTSRSFSTDNYKELIEAVHGPTIMQMDGREHTRMRNLVTPALRGADLRTKFVSVITRTAHRMVEQFQYDGEVDFVTEFARFYPINVMVDMLGLPSQDVPLFRRWYTDFVDYIYDFGRDPSITERAARSKQELQAYLGPVIHRRRLRPGDDLLSVLCTTEVDGVRMDDAHLKAFVSLLLTAGGETTDKVLALLLCNLIAHPEQMAMVRDNRELIDRALAETMRYSPPTHMLMRTAREDVEVSGGIIPAGSIALAMLGAANRDDRHYSNPDRFDIMRAELDPKRAFTGAANHVGFGLGRHFCVGSLLAKMEVNIALNIILDEMQDIQHLAGEPPSRGIGTRGPQTMPLVFTPVPPESTRLVG